MFCRKCGIDNPEGARYCRRCGEPLEGSRTSSGGTSSVPPASRKFQLKICRWNIVLLVCGDILDTACCLPFRLLVDHCPGICFRRESKRQSEELRQSLFLQSDCSMCFSVSCFSKRMFVIICNDVKVKFAAVFSASVLGQETPFCFYIIPASGLFCRFSDDKIKEK